MRNPINTVGVCIFVAGVAIVGFAKHIADKHPNELKAKAEGVKSWFKARFAKPATVESVATGDKTIITETLTP